jgi:alpha-glucoside transport system permease protein
MAQGPPTVTPRTGSSTTAVPGTTVIVPGPRGIRPRSLISPLLFVGPALILIGFLVVYPAIRTIILSFYTQAGIGYNPPLQFTGLGNYLNMAQDPYIHTAVVNNILWIVIVTPVTLVLGVIFAVLFDRVRYEAIAKSIVFIPMAISFTASAAIWKLMYADDPHTGTINAILQHILPHFQGLSFLGDTSFVNFALMGAYVWISLGFAVVILSAALKAIPRDLTEAARIDGATELQIFRRITVPLMWPTITVVGTLTMIGVLKIFDLVYAMTSGGPAGASTVLALRMYVEAFQNSNPGYGSAIAVVLLIAVLPVMAFNIRRFRAEGPRI